MLETAVFDAYFQNRDISETGWRIETKFGIYVGNRWQLTGAYYNLNKIRIPLVIKAWLRGRCYPGILAYEKKWCLLAFPSRTSTILSAGPPWSPRTNGFTYTRLDYIYAVITNVKYTRLISFIFSCKVTDSHLQYNWQSSCKSLAHFRRYHDFNPLQPSVPYIERCELGTLKVKIIRALLC